MEFLSHEGKQSWANLARVRSFLEFDREENIIFWLSFDTTADDMNNALHLASRFNQKDFAEETIKRHPELMHQKNHKGDTPLHIAARNGRSEIAKLLVDQQVSDIEAPPPRAESSIFKIVNNKGDTALHDAVQRGHLEVVKTLIAKHPESKKVCNKVGDSPLFLAVDKKKFDIAQYIAEGDSPQCSYRGRSGMNVLHAAVIRTCRVSHSKDLLELWIHHSKLPTAVIYNVFKAVMFIWKRPLEFIENVGSFLWKYLKQGLSKLLRDKNKVKNFENYVKNLPIREKFWSFVIWCYMRCRKESDKKEEEFLELLIEKFQMQIKESDEKLQWTPLHYAAHFRHTKAVKLLLQFDRTVVYNKDQEGMSALHIAAKKGNVEVIKRIIEEFPETCGLFDVKGRTILHVAVENGEYYVVKYILQTDALEGLLNEQDEDGNTPLHYAAICGHWSILKVLVNDDRVDRGILNNQGLVAHTLVSDMELRFHQKSRISKKLDKKGGPPSLNAIVNRENLQTKDVETRKGQLENNVTNKDSDPKNLSSDDKIQKAIVNTKNSQPEDVETKKRQLPNNVMDKNTDDPKNSLGVPKEDKCRDFREVGGTHILVITIIASVTFAAGFQIPGGVEHGSSVSAASHTLKLIFAAFQIANTLSLCCAIAAIATHFSASTEKECGPYKHLTTFASSLTYTSIWTTGLSYILGTHLVLTKHPLLAAGNLAIFGCTFVLTVIVWYFR